MDLFWSSAPALLLVTGTMLGLSLPLGKLASTAGAPAALWALVVALGAGGVLAAAQAMRRRTIPANAPALRFYLIAAAISYALPNVLVFLSLPHLGAGYVGIMYTLSPIVTLLLSIVLGVRRPNGLGMLGVVVGFAGAMLVASTRGEAGQPAHLGWVAAGLVIPVCLACGNIYRTINRPPGADPIALAAGSQLAAALLLGGYLVSTGEAGLAGILADMPVLTLAQAAASAAMFACYFRLQDVGGPVYLSQIGYVAATIGLVSGTFLFGEHYLLATWAGAAVIVAGLTLATYAQKSA